MPDNQHRKLYSKTYYSRQANVHYAECSRASARCVCKQACSHSPARILLLLSVQKERKNYG